MLKFFIFSTYLMSFLWDIYLPTARYLITIGHFGRTLLVNGKIRIALVGIGNCASSLVQGISYYGSESNGRSGVLNWDIGGYTPSDIEVVAAFDVDKRKVGKPLKEAIFSKPNNTTVFCESLLNCDVLVSMGKILDGVSAHFQEYDNDESIRPSEQKELDKDEIVKILKESEVEILVNYLPVGSEEATKFYVDCALEAGVGVVNCMPCFIASDPEWNKKFVARGIPIIGDDVKAQIGATITHRVLTSLFEDRGVSLDSTYQLNVGGNTDFLNMLNHSRLKSKKISKTMAVQSMMKEDLPARNIHIGPSDYVPWLKDNKICFLRMQGRTFGNVPMNIELRLSVEDSPNSAGIVIDAVRCCKLGLDKNVAGAIEGVSAYLMKHPPKQYPDSVAYQMMKNFILNNG